MVLECCIRKPLKHWRQASGWSPTSSMDNCDSKVQLTVILNLNWAHLQWNISDKHTPFFLLWFFLVTRCHSFILIGHFSFAFLFNNLISNLKTTIIISCDHLWLVLFSLITFMFTFTLNRIQFFLFCWTVFHRTCNINRITIRNPTMVCLITNTNTWKNHQSRIYIFLSDHITSHSSPIFKQSFPLSCLIGTIAEVPLSWNCTNTCVSKTNVYNNQTNTRNMYNKQTNTTDFTVSD